MYTVGIVTSSDKGFNGEREDKSGEIIKEKVETLGFMVKKYSILPDDKEGLKKEFIYLSDELKVDLVLTTGGTGFSLRDVTPEATKEIIQRETPGISEAIRGFSMGITKRAMLSRGVSGIREKTLFINLPGSPKACKEILDFLLEDIKHGINLINNRDRECGGV